MDEASADLFGHVARAVHLTSWIWCLTRRDVSSGFIAPEDTPTTRMELHPLTERGGDRARPGGDPRIPPAGPGIQLLVDRSGGNPLFVRELVAAVQHGDSIGGPARFGRGCRRRPHRPPRRCRPPAAPADVRVGSVLLGRPARRGRRRRARVGQIRSGRGSSRSSSRDAAGDLSFRNALLRDCAYNGLSFRLRRELHSRAGDTIRDAAARHGDDQSGLLSFHYLHAQRSEEAWSYSLHAAEQARGVYANAGGGGVLRAGDRRRPPTAGARRRRNWRERTKGWGTPGT